MIYDQVHRLDQWEEELGTGRPARQASVMMSGSWKQKILRLKNDPPGIRIYLRGRAAAVAGRSNRVRCGREHADRILDHYATLECRLPRRPSSGQMRVRKPDQDLESVQFVQVADWLFAANQAWMNVAALALNLMSWFQSGDATGDPSRLLLEREAVALPSVPDVRGTGYQRTLATVAGPRKRHRNRRY